MPSGTLIESIRFGYGPRLEDGILPAAGLDPARLLVQLQDPQKPIPREGLTLTHRLALLAEQRALSQAAKMGGPKENPAQKALQALMAEELNDWVWDAVVTPNGFAERLVNFWANRLTVAYKKGPGVGFLGPYREEAIRPYIAGRFADMLEASAWHPAMLEYLDQAASVGPSSELGKKRKRGLNENYAREFLELHSMGRGYDQHDVTELARLFAGMGYDENGPGLDLMRAEPWNKKILGMVFEPGLDEIARLINFVARRPETAQSVAQALAVHFIADQPPADLVDAMAQAYLQHDTALIPVYEVLLNHPAAADPKFQKLRRPQEYMVATMRVLGLGLDQSEGKNRLRVDKQLNTLGQPAFRAPDPDGWPDTAEAWLSAPSLAARLNWAEMLGRRYGEKAEPAALAAIALGAEARETIQAVGRAEQRWEGVAVLLGSPGMMRR
ncbi:DUF1800 domain-containing protein [Xinfangfangia sp. CPCC 101601]|uniref:DUF1800 domain-containing protein n=1 Tax=Pseudogemmobacter lacusdianii TaxID=3069608 RepID=A0ABU0VXX7_9RHOB|nr:DUF1800 domain-containing protein [Xinfangfangia sp. CPCC 101601]MDQ2066587.1 DUF1800 domain-containing protein [Xinfangfangia sp. CPCC 101601]